MTKKFQKLMEPAYIGKVRTRNRILKMGSHFGWFEYRDGYVNEKELGFYEAIARGGVGLITVAAPNWDYPMSLLPNVAYRLDDDKYIESMSGFTKVIHKYGCPAFIQMMHCGPLYPAKIFGGQPVAASCLPKGEIPRPQSDVARELTVAEIQEISEKFVQGVVRAQKAGFEGVEINSGSTHFFNSFLSRAWNRRQDAYGVGSLESRAKIVVDLIREIKKRCGQEFAIVNLINGAEVGLDKGITPEESQGIARILEKAGSDAINVRIDYYLRPADPTLRDSTHFPDLVFYPEPPHPLGEKIDGSRHGQGAWVPVAAYVKQGVSIPVIAQGRLDAELGEKILRNGMADFISLTRRLFADPELPNKIASGRFEDIAPCTGCLTCFNAVETYLARPQSQSAKCRVNAAFGREYEYEIKPAERKKKVMVVGGGPAGLEAARVAAMRGHKVVLYEKERRLGGAMNMAGMVKGYEREDLDSLLRYLETQVCKCGVEGRLGKEVNRTLIEEVKPDALVIATGGKHNIPNLPGINRKNVLTRQALHSRVKGYLRFFSPRTLRRLTGIWLPVGKRVVIMGGDVQGCQTAEFLVKRGRKVTIVETGKEIGSHVLETLVRPQLLNWLAEKGVTMLTEVKFEEITDKGLTITAKDGKKQTIEADTIVTALPLLPDTALLKSLDSIVPEIHSIGDCREPALIADAIADGSRIGRII